MIPKPPRPRRALFAAVAAAALGVLGFGAAPAASRFVAGTIANEFVCVPASSTSRIVSGPSPPFVSVNTRVTVSNPTRAVPKSVPASADGSLLLAIAAPFVPSSPHSGPYAANTFVTVGAAAHSAFPAWLAAIRTSP